MQISDITSLRRASDAPKGGTTFLPDMSTTSSTDPAITKSFQPSVAAKRREKTALI